MMIEAEVMSELTEWRCASCGEECPFCDRHTFDERQVLDSETAYALFSLWPVSPYHALIIPHRHISDESALTPQEILGIFTIKDKLINAVARKTGLNAYNFGVNIGPDAGQSVPHLHYHVIFRMRGDVPNPRGGIRNIIPSSGYPIQDMAREDEVQLWTEEIRAFISQHKKKEPTTR